MQEKDIVTRFYNSVQEEERLSPRHGQVEFLTTMRYIHRYLEPGMRVLEVGAGTGRYSLALAREGYSVEAVELVERNIEVFRSKICPEDSVKVQQGNALELSAYPDGSFDITLLLGPMYRLFEEEKKRRALAEAIRVTRKGGVLFVAYCMNEATVIQYCFQKGTLWEDRKKGLLSDDFHWTPNENDAFSLMRTEEILALTEEYPVTRLHLLATDGASRYMEDTIDRMDDKMFSAYLEYHFSVCERRDLLGASNHTLDVLRRQ